jgi:PIN domain nuclease of toxin-antitoxin system
MARFLERPGIKPVPLGHRAACRSYRLHHLPQCDPADRLLIAIAIELACPLVTHDERILAFAGPGMAASMGSPPAHDV